MDPGAVFLRFSATLLFGDVSLRSPSPHQLSPLENPHQIVDEELGVAVAVTFGAAVASDMISLGG